MYLIHLVGNKFGVHTKKGMRYFFTENDAKEFIKQLQE